MNNQLSKGIPDKTRIEAIDAATDGAAVDRDALAAFVRAAESGDIADCAPSTIAAAGRVVRALLAADDGSPADTAVPSEQKWAAATGHTDSVAAAAPSPSISEQAWPIAQDQLPAAIDQQAASTAYEAVLEHLIAAGPATRADIVANVMPEYPLGYTPPPDGAPNGGEWWTAVIQPALRLDVTVTHDDHAGYLLGDWIG